MGAEDGEEAFRAGVVAPAVASSWSRRRPRAVSPGLGNGVTLPSIPRPGPGGVLDSTPRGSLSGLPGSGGPVWGRSPPGSFGGLLSAPAFVTGWPPVLKVFCRSWRPPACSSVCPCPGTSGASNVTSANSSGVRASTADKAGVPARRPEAAAFIDSPSGCEFIPGSRSTDRTASSSPDETAPEGGSSVGPAPTGDGASVATGSPTGSSSTASRMGCVEGA